MKFSAKAIDVFCYVVEIFLHNPLLFVMLSISQSKSCVTKEKLSTYLELITCNHNLEDAVELSSDQLRATVTLKTPVNCKYLNVSLNSLLLLILCTICLNTVSVNV